ncbi:NEP1-interacting protein-like 1 [Panicum miliaceum]|uniref:NEP1-interacting protein-like 1 n=1 Tax=Panicum miliaceum TaxID=4540 RepID=A0A3L6RYI7_PANMI|nr:NEP1-interacting protein-like 1 [Panicum miliaceum]
MQPHPGAASPGRRQCASEAAALGLRPPRAGAPDHQPRGAALPEGEPRRASATAGLPSFTYNRSAKHNVTGGGAGEEAATCSVFLGTFQLGETVHRSVAGGGEAHSSCPICRTGTEPV